MHEQLVEYLLDLISPPGDRALFVPSLEDLCGLEFADDDSVCGVVTCGQPTPEQTAHLMRVLMPGAHLLVMAPDEQPTGHTGACTLEDGGFEIRDSVLLVQQAERFHYVAKAGRSEREAGCFHLTGKAGHEAVDRKEDTAGLNNPRAGAGRTASLVKNFHPTCKPIGIMERLLASVPTDNGPVVDPFMGSGTTGVGCVKTGHDFIGMEREADYLPIADARIRYWDAEHEGWDRADVTSDAPPPPAKKTMTLEDLFGG